MIPKFTYEQVKNALITNHGLINQAAKYLNCDNTTIYNYLKRFSKLKEDLNNIREANIDFVESKLMNLIEQENPTAIIFFLKTQGKSRGYIERIENKIEFQSIEVQLPKQLIDE